MWSGIIAKAEKATAWVGRYCDLDRAARWHKLALIIGMTGWAGRWILVAFLATDVMVESEPAQAATPGMTQTDDSMKTLFYAAAIITCMAIKWAGWTYGGVGYVHHRRKNSEAY
jgi:hypothetical protein